MSAVFWESNCVKLRAAANCETDYLMSVNMYDSVMKVEGSLKTQN